MQNQTKPEPLGLSMAKLVLAVAVVVFLGAVLGMAGWAAKNKPVKISKPQVSPVPVSSQTINSFSGKLISGGVECRLFEANDGIIYSLQGAGKLFEGLNDGDTVSIKGKFVEKSYCMQGKKTIKLLEIDYVKDETADWKTYRNEEFEFAVKYPQDWIIQDSSKKVISIYPPKISASQKLFDGIVVNVDTEDGVYTLNDYLNKNIVVNPYSRPQEFKKFSELFPDYEIVKIDGKDGIKLKKVISAIEVPDQRVISIVLFGEDIIVEIMSEEEYESIYNQVLSTFKFIEK